MEWINSFFETLKISAEKPILTTFLFFFGGILSSLFPCYYPLIPITVGFLQKRKAKYFWIHPLFYWLGTLFIYLLLGIFAATTGIILSKILQNPWVIIGIGILFLYLSFAVIDFVSLEPKFFRKLEEKTKTKDSLIFTFLMGIFSGLAASACVSPALVSVLLYVVQTSALLEKNIFSLIFGLSLTVSYGAGLGIPFFLSGIVGAKLPKSGKWMDWIKKIFFVLIFFISFYQIHKGLIVFKIQENISFYILIIIFLSILIIYFILKKIIQDIFYFRKFYTYATIILVSLFLFISVQIYADKNIPNTLEQKVYEQNYGIYENKKNLKIYRNYKEALEEAKKQNKLVFIDFYADWCTNCVEFSKLMESDEGLNQILQKMIVLKIYDTDSIFELFSQKQGYEELQIGLPFFVILDPEEKIIYKTTNYRDKKNFEKALEVFK